MKNIPDISIIIPSYNSKKNIKQTIISCINQDYQNIEIIIVDDKSTDDSLKTIEDIALNEPRLKVIKHQKNLGTFAARANGIYSATGEIIIFLDSDDKLRPNTARLVLETMHKNNSDMVFFGIKNEGKKIRLSKPLPKSPLIREEILKGFICDSSEPVWGIGGKAIRRPLLLEALKVLNYVDKKFLVAEDALLCFVSAALANYSLSLNQELYVYIENPNSITQESSNVEKRQEQLELALHYFNCLNNSKLVKHKYFKHALKKTFQILNATKVLNLRFEKGYLNSYFQAWRINPQIKYLIIIFLYIISLGNLKR